MGPSKVWIRHSSAHLFPSSLRCTALLLAIAYGLQQRYQRLLDCVWMTLERRSL